MAKQIVTRAKSGGGISVRLGEPVVIARADPSVRGWGPYQFPRVERLAGGEIHVAYHIHRDSAQDYGLDMGHAVSGDDGRTWRVLPGEPASPGGIELDDGSRLLADTAKSTPVGELQLPAPMASTHATYVDYDYYSPPHLPPDLARGWPLLRLDKGATVWRRDWATVKVNPAADYRSVTEKVFVVPFLEQDRIKRVSDGSLMATLYLLPQVGLRGRIMRTFMTRIVRSTDGGATWLEVGAIPYRPDMSQDPHWDNRDGFTEPELQELPDGSFMVLMRTSDGNANGPMYVAYSSDRCVTWSPPRVFDEVGVWPQLLAMPGGVTITSYGRPGLYARATDDPAGKRWSDRATVVTPGEMGSDTCSYSDLIALGERSALIVYSDFRQKDEQGRTCKAMMCRRIEIE